QTGIVVDVEAALGAERLPTDIETALYRIVQESLNNVVKHSRARSVTVVVTRRPGAVTAVVEDDGQGFDPESVREDGYGLVGMRERLALIGGQLRIESSPGA